MKKIHPLRLTVLLVLCAALLCLPVCAEDTTGSLTISYPLDGTVYHIYQVGKLENGDIVMNDEFSGVDTSDMATAAGVMADMVELTGVCKELASGTVTNGSVTFSNLPMAVYLLTGEAGVKDGVNYWPTPFLVSVPQTGTDGAFQWSVSAEGKHETDMEISVVKKWQGDIVAYRPASVTVHLVVDGKDYGDPVTLDYTNGWSYTWENLPPKNYYVREDAVSRYTTVIVKNGNTYTITNVWKTVPQTGQLWWPVTVLTVAGLVLLCLGLIRRRRRDTNE